MICKSFAINKADDYASLLAVLEERFNPSCESGQGLQKTEESVRSILAQVRATGLEAVVEYTRQYDAPEFSAEQFRITPAALAEAAAALTPGDRSAILEAAANIRAFHEEQKGNSWFTTRPDGSVLGQRLLPVDRAGLYIPGGKAGLNPLISSLIMNVIPAQVAGVKEIALISPPMHNGEVSPFIKATAHLLGVTEVYAAGSAWAVGALAYGAGPLKPVDVIAGPGNIYVATAKRLLIGTVGIDMIAGPSEIFIIADASANPAWVAADMLSQAEHDPMASAVCVTPSKDMADKVLAELAKQTPALPRAEVAAQSLKDFGAVVYTSDMQLAVDLANAVAPEHLELLVADPWALMPSIRHAGAVFMGHYASEAFGDYFAGPNHVLPTMRTARFSSALSVEVFMKKMSVVGTSRAFAKASAQAVAQLARIEGLEAHALSALKRLE